VAYFCSYSSQEWIPSINKRSKYFGHIKMDRFFFLGKFSLTTDCVSSWPIQIPHVLPSVLLPKSTPFHAVIQTPTNTWFAGLRRVCPPSKWLLKWFYHFCTADAKLPCMDHSIMPHGTFVHPCLINH